MKILSPPHQRALAKSLSQALTADYIETRIDSFNDQELRVQILGDLYEQEIVIVHATSKPANDHLMQLLLMVDAARRAGARRIIAVIPYFGYSRQDRPSYDHGPISASLVARLLEAAGIHQLITVDLHSKQIEGFFSIGVQNLDPLPLFLPFLNTLPECVIISPDIGGLIRARRFSQHLKCDLAIINKSRDPHGACHMSEVVGNVHGKQCVIIDDIVDSAGTLCHAAELLIQKGARSVEACVTHAVLSEPACERIQMSPLTRLLTTDSIVHPALPEKCQVIPLNTLLQPALARVQKSLHPHNPPIVTPDSNVRVTYSEAPTAPYGTESSPRHMHETSWTVPTET